MHRCVSERASEHTPSRAYDYTSCVRHKNVSGTRMPRDRGLTHGPVQHDKKLVRLKGHLQ